MPMTRKKAHAQVDAILESLGISRTEFDKRRINYSTGDARLKELAYLQDLITPRRRPRKAVRRRSESS